jgi:uncharacterized surface protein with fasciclin (FAS1) repeats
MNNKLTKVFGQLFVAALFLAGANVIVGCNPEPDESDMYTSTGETAEDFIARKPNLSAFNTILKRVGLDRNLSSYGEYSCFVPTNDAITAYIDSLYDDTTNKDLPHNGMTQRGLDGLTDSLCNDIAKYHLANGINNSVDLGAGSTVRTMLGRTFTSETSVKYQGMVALEQEAVIIEPDSLVTNGVVHVLNKVIPRSNRVVAAEMERLEEYSIFMKALKETGLVDSLEKTKKPVEYDLPAAESMDNGNSAGNRLYSPKECLIKYTIFAEPDVVMKAALKKAGYSEDFEGLVQFANDTYRDADQWYDMLAEKGLWNNDTKTFEKKVSTGRDFRNRNNALNMFVSYHILFAGMPVNELVFEYSSKTATSWNYVNGCGPFDYYETMLPNTLMKIWQPTWKSNTTYINRYIKNNTLTDQLGQLGKDGMGSDGMHTVVREGIRVVRTSTDQYKTNIQSYNGYIHAIRDMLVYDRLVPQGVLHERLRFDSTTFLPELINNGIRMSTQAEVKALNGGGSGARVAFALDYFDGVVSYTKENRFRYNVKGGGYNAWQGDTFQGWGNYDLAIKMPPLPTGVYEFRIFYTPMSHGGMMMFYMGDSKKLSSMVPLDIPLDVRIPMTDPRIGSLYFGDEDDMGIATDAAMRNRGYMRGLYSYKDHPGDGKGAPVDDPLCQTTENQRSDKRNASFRKIMSRSLEVKQSGEKWFRIKNVIPDETDLKWQLDYIEFVPLDVVGNTQYSEDWF